MTALAHHPTMVRNLLETELTRVELDDQLLLDRQRDRLAHRLAAHLAGERALVELEPLRHAAAIDALERRHDAGLLPALLADRHRVAGLHEEARDRHRLAVHLHVAVADE